MNGLGIIHTFLCAGIVFGWTSLESVLRAEGVFSDDPNAALRFTTCFTAGAVGNYLSNLPCGLFLDTFGPKCTGSAASVGFALGLWLCSLAVQEPAALLVGFFLLGFFGPAIQLPTLNLSCLFPEGGAVVMSMQAACFDGGCAIFYFTKILFLAGFSSQDFFRMYLIVPVFTLTTSLLFWPWETLNNSESPATHKSPNIGGPGSPFLSARQRSLPDLASLTYSPGSQGGGPRGNPTALSALLSSRYSSSDSSLVELGAREGGSRGMEAKTPRTHAISAIPELPAPLGPSHSASPCPNTGRSKLWSMLQQGEYIFLSLFTAIHILKLNFVVSSVDEQLHMAFRESTAESLLWNFGWMLPLGFVIMPVASYLLERSPLHAFQLANVMGISYAVALQWGGPKVQLFVTFPLVATSRQLVYSTVFHQIAALFGFSHYGILLGLTNLLVSLLGLVQYLLAKWAESTGSYLGANCALLALSLPPFAVFLVIRRRG